MALNYGRVTNGADFSDADLTNVNFTRANLDGVNIDRTVVVNANFRNVKNLLELQFITAPTGIVEIRGKLRKQGAKNADRTLTYLIKTSELNQKKKDKKWIEYSVNWVLFDLSCRWGKEPSRPLRFILYLFLICGFINFALLLKKPGEELNFHIPFVKHDEKKGTFTETGVFSIHKLIKENNKAYRYNPKTILQILFRSYQYSLYSAFQIGWRDLTVGNWLERVQRKPYLLRSRGSIRIISGIQSIISAYLLALNILTYFGHPFDW